MTFSTTQKRLILVIIIAIMLLPLFTGATEVAFAAKQAYSDVLADLKKDNAFSASDYPIIENDYSLQVIQIAESTDKELFVYVYQPSVGKKFVASSINISLAVGDDISFINYKLKLLSTKDTLNKYIVENLVVSDDATRYYTISSIYRPFDATIDAAADNDNTISEVLYAVAKEYCFCVVDGKPHCSVVDIETITVTDKFVGFARYKDGFSLVSKSCDSHFVAFSTNKPIDNLLEADVYYTQQERTQNYPAGLPPSKPKFSAVEEKYSYLKHTQKVAFTGKGWGASTFKWDRIETVEQFLSENESKENVYAGALIDIYNINKLTDEGKKALREKQWVLRFAETDFLVESILGGSHFIKNTIVADVTILRLKFETDGTVYNLGVIDNKQSGSGKPGNENELKVEASQNLENFWRLFKIVLIVIVVVALFVLFLYAVVSIVIKKRQLDAIRSKKRKEKESQKIAQKQALQQVEKEAEKQVKKQTKRTSEKPQPKKPVKVTSKKAGANRKKWTK